jgi:pimeloyl-ACP methyl ester carboxylesterase
VLELYKAPLRVEGWCESLIETTRLRKEQSDLGAYFRDARSLPALVLTGEHDRLVPPVRTEQLCAELPNSRLVIVHDCGHLSHEEAPGTLLQHLIPFCAAVADGAAALKGMHNRGSMGGLAAGQAEQGIVYAGSPDIV